MKSTIKPVSLYSSYALHKPAVSISPDFKKGIHLVVNNSNPGFSKKFFKSIAYLSAGIKTGSFN